MTNKLLLVDYENVQQLDFTLLGDGHQVAIFVGANQKNVPIDLVTAAQKLGGRVEWRRVEGSGSNALDFHIACELGRVLERSPNVHCTVLSKDKGFDPLLRHLNMNGLVAGASTACSSWAPKLRQRANRTTSEQSSCSERRSRMRGRARG